MSAMPASSLNSIAEKKGVDGRDEAGNDENHVFSFQDQSHLWQQALPPSPYRKLVRVQP